MESDHEKDKRSYLGRGKMLNMIVIMIESNSQVRYVRIGRFNFRVLVIILSYVFLEKIDLPKLDFHNEPRQLSKALTQF